MARLFAGDTGLPQLDSLGYYPGWSLFLTPIWWFTHDPEQVYRAALLVGVAVAMATIWPTALLAKAFGARTAPAIAVAALAMSLPSRTVPAAYVLSEISVMFFLAWTAVFGLAHGRRPRVWTAVALSVSALGCLISHPRALVVVAVCAIWLVLQVRRSWLGTIAGLVVLGAGVTLAQRWMASVFEQVLARDFGQTDNLSKSLESFDPTLFAGAVSGQLWAQQVASLGLVGLGFVVISRRVFGDLFKRRLHPEAFVWGLVVAGALASIATWSGSAWLVKSTRLDLWMYTRYTDPYTHLAIIAALVAVIARVRRSDAIVNLVLAVPLIVGVFAIAAERATLTGYMGVSQTAGIRPWVPLLRQGEVGGYSLFWVVPSVVLVVALVVMPLLSRWPLVAIVAFGVCAAAMSWSSPSDSLRPAPRQSLAAIERLGDAVGRDDLTVVIDPRCRGGRYLTVNWMAYWFSPHPVKVAPATEARSDEVVVTCPPEAEPAPGWTRFGESTSLIFGLWVRPGPLSGAAAQIDQGQNEPQN